ncbi:hypothetical protein C8J57DRAFT_1232937 [Mycena rebaudengoi]|nr:hypothetical protein C8J57DRAFT_1232937 [Mycena rebaudengoi]
MIGYPTLIGEEVLNNICSVLFVTGKPLSGLKYAKEAHRWAEHTGNMYGQARLLWLQGRCHIVVAKYWPAQHLLQKSRDIVAQQQSVLEIYILNEQAEIHLMKSEYLESHKLQVAIASIGKKHSPKSGCGSVSFDGIVWASSQTDRDGPHGAAREMFEKCLAVSQDISTVETYDLAWRPTIVQTEHAMWSRASNMMVSAYGLRPKQASTPGIELQGQTQDNASIPMPWPDLFRRRLLLMDSPMDVHHWRADCLVRIADILNNRGEVMEAVEMWKAARPLFKRSSQMQDVIKIDVKLAEVDSAILIEYEEKLRHLSELHVPASGPGEAYNGEDGEEDQLAHGSDFGDKGRQGVLV